MTAYVQIQNNKVITVYGCPQDPSDKPGYCEIADDDPRYLVFINPPNKEIDAEILRLECLVTPRRAREALLTDEGKAWLANLDAQIVALRAQRR